MADAWSKASPEAIGAFFDAFDGHVAVYDTFEAEITIVFRKRVRIPAVYGTMDNWPPECRSSNILFTNLEESGLRDVARKAHAEFDIVGWKESHINRKTERGSRRKANSA